MRPRLSFANVASALALFISLGGGAYAATGKLVRADETIRACVAKSGSVRIVTAKQSCRTRETAVTWNRRGPVGRTGATGPRGPAGERGPAGADGANGRDVDASNHYTKAESDARYLATGGKAADADKLDGADRTDFAGAGDLLFARVASNGATVVGSRPA